MTHFNKLFSPIFLEEKEIRKLLELLFFSHRDFMSITDEALKKIQFSRIHYRIIYFVNKHRKITIRELLQILQITKQSLSHVLDQLVKQNYIDMSVGNDRRTKVLKLTKKGIELEKKLSKIQITKLKNLLQNINENDINSFKKILFTMIDSNGKNIFNKLNE